MIRSSLRRICILLAIAVTLTTAGVVAGAEQNTFTEWVTTWPIMAGVVGGGSGEGWYAGEVLKYIDGPTTVIEALYHFSGSAHSFTALVHVEQTGLKGVINGVVTEGWQKGSQVHGEYLQVKSKQSPDGIAYQGALNILASEASN